MGRFASTVAFYEFTRQPYGPTFFQTVARDLKFDRGKRLLDLGTGPGLLALGFAPYVRKVCGVDPEPDMLRAAQSKARQFGVALRLVEGTAERLPDDIGLFDIVTIGRALHWMEPQRTRAALDHVVGRGGMVLICSATSVPDGRNPWLAAYDAARKHWSEDASHIRHRERNAFFAGTRFHAAETIRVETQRDIAVGDLVDRVLSMSSSSPDQLGGDVEAMRAAVRDALAPFAEADSIREIVEARADVFQSKPSGHA